MERKDFIELITNAFRVHQVVTLLGPRQCGKTTLARMYIDHLGGIDRANYFDLEDPEHVERLAAAKTVLSQLRGLIVIDEVQRRKELFPILRVLVDTPGLNQKYLILGSASRDLIQQSSETLAGRIQHLEVTPFNSLEVGDSSLLWVRGGFPRSYLANTDEDSLNWRKSYISNFLERDVPALGFQIAPESLRRFWLMLAHYHGALFNASEIGSSLGASDTTMRRYLDILSGTFMVRQLSPWYENIGKRQVKSPKIYFRDSGIFHALLGLRDRDALLAHPKLGASWEGMALEEIIRIHQATPEEVYFWAVHGQVDLDLMILKDGKRLGFEFKYSDAPKATRSMHVAMEDLKLNSLTVIFPGESEYPLAKNIWAQGFQSWITQKRHFE